MSADIFEAIALADEPAATAQTMGIFALTQNEDVFKHIN